MVKTEGCFLLRLFPFINHINYNNEIYFNEFLCNFFFELMVKIEGCFLFRLFPFINNNNYNNEI